MKSRHVQMIAIGGSIGAGFFVGSGATLSRGGPASMLLSFSLVGIMLFNVVHALGELAITYPISGGFYTYSARFIDRSWGFAMGWNYVLQMVIVFPLELTVSAVTIQYWDASISPGVWITVFFIAVIIINVFGTLGYAEEEFWASVFKLAATVVFIIICLVMVCGGGPTGGRYDDYWGARLWYDPGAFKNGFKGFCSVLISAAFSFAGTELVGLAAAEAENPVKSMPGAIKQVFWRITVFYIVGLFFVGLLISSNDPALLSDQPYADAKASPFVLVGKYAGLTGFDHFMNTVILVSVLSIGVAAVYGSSRTLTALGQQGYAPKAFTYIDQSGRPLTSVGFTMIFGFLAFINLSASGATVFDWLLALSGLSALLTWGSICLAHIRFRAAWKKQGHTLDELPFKAVGGLTGSWIGLILCCLMLIAQFYTAITAPPGESGMGTAENFFKKYMTIPIVLLFWVCGYAWKRESWLKLDDIDLDSGRREHDWDAINAQRRELAGFPAWKRLIFTLFV